MRMEAVLPLAVLLSAAPAVAVTRVTTVTHVVTLPLQATDFDTVLALPGFQLRGARLQAATLTLSGTLAGATALENLARRPVTLKARLDGDFDLRRPDGSPLLSLRPRLTDSVDLAAFDGRIDYAGASGRAWSGAATDSASVTFDRPADLGLFTGAAQLLLPLVVTGRSFVTGGGNMRSRFDSAAAAEARVSYSYTAGAVPEPASWAMLITGFGLIGSTLRRRRRAMALA